jgi:S-methylmethionine-dependent homocysteine/selenocysteine methylase
MIPMQWEFEERIGERLIDVSVKRRKYLRYHNRYVLKRNRDLPKISHTFGAYDKLMRRMSAGETILIDGGTGTEVERRGVPQLANAWNGGGALSHPNILRQIHQDYITHGAEIIIANTFATSRNLMEDAGCLDLFDEYNRRSTEIACEARTALNADQVLVAGGISHWSFSGRLPSLISLEKGAAEQAKIMKEAGADLVMLEMMIDIERMKAVYQGANTSGLPIWVGLSCAADNEGIVRLQNGNADADGHQRSASGATLAEAITALNDLDIPLINIMHTDVIFVDACLDVLDKRWDGLVGVYAHSGAIINGEWVFEETISPAEYTAYAERWLRRGVNLIGGCCGIRPDHIHELRPLVEKYA